MAGHQTRMQPKHDGALRESLDRMEPELRILAGTAMILQTLAETADAVEPIALAAVAHLARDTTAKLESSWREARNALR